MAHCIWNSLRSCNGIGIIYLPAQYYLLPFSIRACLFSSKDSSNEPPSTTSVDGKNASTTKFPAGSDGPSKNLVKNATILVQHGCDIRELPVIVRKMREKEFALLITDEKIRAPSLSSATMSAKSADDYSANKMPANMDLEMEVMKNIKSCRSIKGVLTILCDRKKDATYTDFSPNVAIVALEKILKVGSSLELKKMDENNSFEQIINCIVFHAESKSILNFLDELRAYPEMGKTIDMLGNELVYRCSENALPIEECCDAIEVLTRCRRPEMVEKFWSGFADQETAINERNMQFVFSILPQLKMSRRAVLTVLEKRVPQLWWQMSSKASIEVLQALVACKTSSYRVMQTLSRWLNTNIHGLAEDELGAMIEAFTQLTYSDAQIERAIERYIKAKGAKVSSQNLIVTILHHCEVFRLRNRHILNGCSEFFIANFRQVDPTYLKQLVCPFGYLDFIPLNAVKFFCTLSMCIDLHFVKIHPSDVINIMFAYLCLERFPLNFVNRIFNPYFLDALHTRTCTDRLDNVRGMLKVFDTGLTLECTDYDGPLLPRDHSAKAVFHDGRIKRIVNHITTELEELAGGPECMTKFSVLQHLPVNSLYLVDVIFHPAGMGNVLLMNLMKEWNINVAVLVHLPEYYDSTGNYLIGPQVMRIRHLRRLGLKVATLRFDILYKMKIHPNELRRYLVERMKVALDALPPPGTSFTDGLSPRT